MANDVVVVLDDAWLMEPNGSVFIAKGERWAASDPLVKRHPGAFRAAGSEDVRSTEVIETATAEPGEKRQVRRSS